MKMEPARQAALDAAAELLEFLQGSTGRVFAVVEPQDLKSKFPALQLSFKETSLPQDPDTIIYELIRPPAD